MDLPLIQWAVSEKLTCISFEDSTNEYIKQDLINCSELIDYEFNSHRTEKIKPISEYDLIQDCEYSNWLDEDPTDNETITFSFSE